MSKSLSLLLPAPLLAGLWCAAPASAQWVKFVDETASRLVSAPGVGAADPEEKDYDWGDVNNDGWIDLVVVRKQPFTSAGRKVNVLFMNERGVLVDRTAEHVTSSDIPGDNGFNTPTNDRDVRVVDVDNDGWKDIVTAVTLSDGQPKHISHPRVYMNLGEDAGGTWQGFHYEDARIPQLAGLVPSGPYAGAPHAPRFCAVAAGDVTGNGYPDLFFSDYDQGGSQTLDFNDRLLVNDGNGYFSDESTQRMQQSWLDSSFGAQALIADLNGDGANDVVKVNALGAYHTAAIYNNPDNPGFFKSHQIILNSSTYFAMVGDLNKNGRLDIVIVDDGNDRWRMNMGNDANGQVIWGPQQFLNQFGFRGNIVLEDLNNDSWLDILIADVDVDLGTCTGSTAADIYRHNGNAQNVDFIHDRGNIPGSKLTRTFDLAVFDIDGDGWKDVVAGRCSGTVVFMNQPTFGISFEYPNGRPTMLMAGEPTELLVKMEAFGQPIAPGTATLHVSVDGGAYSAITMNSVGTNYIATIPPVDCLSRVRYYVSAQLTGGGTLTDPPNAPTAVFSSISAAGTQVAFYDDVESSIEGWIIESDPSLEGGEWEQAVPVGTICCSGQLATPDGDASADPNGMAFTTENCAPGQFPGTCNVQYGPTYLITPAFNLAGADAVVSYDRWFFCSTASSPERADFLITQVSNDGGDSWVTVHLTGGTGSAWENASFLVGDYVEPTADMRVRFVVEDADNASITNAGIDNFLVDKLVCGGTCAGDVNGDGVVDVMDMLGVLAEWGACDGDCPADINGDGAVDVSDMMAVLAAWGACD